MSSKRAFPPPRTQVVLALTLLSATSCVSWKVIVDGEINQELVDLVVEGVAFEMELEPTAPIPVAILHRDEIDASFFYESGGLHDPRDPDRARAETAMGIRSRTDPDAEFGVEVRSRVLRGLYRSVDRTVYYVPEPPVSSSGVQFIDPWAAAADEYILAHEVVHAFQHQHYPQYFEPDELWAEQFDARRALHATIEGVADYYAARSMWFMGEPIHPDERDSQRPRPSALDEEHPLMQAGLRFSYDHGYRLAYRNGLALLDDPPASTEQVMKARDTDRREAFDAISLSELEGRFEEAGCRRLHANTLGAFGISIWLQSLGVDTSTSAGKGWNGDRWIAFDCYGRVVTAWLSTWDYPAAAMHFAGRVRRASEQMRLRRSIASDWTVTRHGLDVLATSYHRLLAPEEVLSAARRARVVTRDELAAHFAPTRTDP